MLRLLGLLSVAAAVTALTFDFGDAPASYGTLLNDDGARHLKVGTCKTIGKNPTDYESEAFEHLLAMGDDTHNIQDEDGLKLLGTIRRGAVLPAEISFTGEGTGFLSGWIDWNRNGYFDHPSERVFAQIDITKNKQVEMPVVPNDATPGLTYIRLRIAPTPNNILPTGEVTGGEVEDHAIFVLCGSEETMNECICPMEQVRIVGELPRESKMYQPFKIVWEADEELLELEGAGLHIGLYQQNILIKDVVQFADLRDGAYIWAPHNMMPGKYELRVTHLGTGCVVTSSPFDVLLPYEDTQ